MLSFSHLRHSHRQSQAAKTEPHCFYIATLKMLLWCHARASHVLNLTKYHSLSHTWLIVTKMMMMIQRAVVYCADNCFYATATATADCGFFGL